MYRFLFVYVLFCVSYPLCAQADSLHWKTANGVYRNFKQLKNQTPLKTIPIQVENERMYWAEEWEGEYEHVPYNEQFGNKIFNAFAYSIGDSTYINFAGTYFPLFEREDSLFFYGFDIDDRYLQETLEYHVGIGIAFGAIGLAIHKTKNEWQNGRRKFYFDQETGAVRAASNKKSGFFFLEGPESDKELIVLYRLKKNERSETLDLIVSQNDTLTFEHHQYNEIMVYKGTRELLVEINGKQHNLQITPAEENYFRIEFLQSQDKPRVVKMSKDEGDFESVIPFNATLKRQNKLARARKKKLE